MATTPQSHARVEVTLEKSGERPTLGAQALVTALFLLLDPEEDHFALTDSTQLASWSAILYKHLHSITVVITFSQKA